MGVSNWVGAVWLEVLELVLEGFLVEQPVDERTVDEPAAVERIAEARMTPLVLPPLSSLAEDLPL